MINGHPYMQAAISGEVARLAAAIEGERNSALFKSTAALASLGMAEGEILHHLKPVAEGIGLRGKELYSTVKSGVKAGHASPRDVPTRSAPVLASAGVSKVARDKSNKSQPIFFPGGDEGPRRSNDEVRRHVFRRNGQPVRVKIKRSGAFVNWYRVKREETDGWQAGKPGDYQACPYVGAFDPFDKELLADVMYWPEGEKDCDTLSKHCLASFTFGGTGDGLPDGVRDYLRGRQVIILADNDVSGQAHALKKADLASAVAASVKVVMFPELPTAGDVTDFLQSATVADLEQRVADTEPWAPPQKLDVVSEQSGWRNAIISASDLKAKTFKPVSFVVPDYIPEGVTIFAGKPKVGKSWLLYDICLASAAGRFVLGSIKPAQGNVLYLALEDSERRLKRRLKKLCPDEAWPSCLTLATTWRRTDMGGVDDIAEWCDSVPHPVLVVIDTLEKIRQLAKPGSSAYTTDYMAISALHKLAHERGIAIVVIHHVRKMEADDPFDMVSGTNGLTGAADTILVLKRQAGNVTLYARGRDIEEKETACTFNKVSCRWTLLGDAGHVHSSGERSAVTQALSSAGESGMAISEIMAATERNDRNALDQLLFKMQRDGEVIRLKRGVYARPGKIGKKERNDNQTTERHQETDDLTNLTDLTGTDHMETVQ